MAENDRLDRTTIHVEDLDAVFGGDDRHLIAPLVADLQARTQLTRAPSRVTFYAVRRREMMSSAPDQANVTGLNRRQAPMITTAKNTSTMPCTTANTGPDGGFGGTAGASACSAGTLRKLWMTSTKTLR